MSDEPLVAQSETTTKVSSALTPALVLAGCTLAGGLAGLRFGPSEASAVFVGLTVGGPLLAAAQITFFTFCDRDRLHSEKFLERKMLISKIPPQIGDAGTVIEIEPASDATSNPKAIESGDV